jgi:hypothetical protein
VSLFETGTVTLNGRVYGGETMRRRARYLFDAEGKLLAPAAVTEELLADQQPGWAPAFLLELPGTTWLLLVTTTVFLQIVVWLDLTLVFGLVLGGTLLVRLLALVMFGPAAALAVSGMGLLTFTFAMLTRLVLLVFTLPHQALAVAHTVVKEATRNRLSLMFVIVLLICLPLLPLTLDPDAPLRFRVQTFISRSLSMTYVMAASMTIFLACATVAFEIRDRQIWQLVSKPMRRMNYLAGKWLGVLAVNVVILIVAGLSIFTYIQYLSQQPVANTIEGQLDRLAVTDEVLTARLGAFPVLTALAPDQLRNEVENTIQSDPELLRQGEVPLSTKRKIARELQEEFINNQRSVPPVERDSPGGNEKTYRFKGLGPAKRLQSTLTLHYRFHIFRDDEHTTYPVVFYVNGDTSTAVSRDYIPTVTHTLPIGTDLVRDDGTMDITIVNTFEPPPDMPGRGELNFEADDFELMYKVATFEANFFRAVVMTWLKLAFLAVLGIAAATLLSFPVACLLTFTVFLAGTIGPFLSMSLEEYYPTSAADLDWTNIGLVIQWGFQSFIRWTAQGLVFALSSFGEYQPTQDLVKGRLIAWSTVAQGAAWLGLTWSGLAMLFGYVVIRNRQLAIYSGHG